MAHYTLRWNGGSDEPELAATDGRDQRGYSPVPGRAEGSRLAGNLALANRRLRAAASKGDQAMTTLDDVRAEIVARRKRMQQIIQDATSDRDCADAELAAHDRAVALCGDGMVSRPARAPRRHIGAMVYNALTDEPQSIEAIGKKIGAPPSVVKITLRRLAVADGKCGSSTVSVSSSGWTR
jgi:hypothetical protein